jgi:hypothetical protein
MDTGDHIDVRMLGVPYRIRTSKGALRFGSGWLEVRPPGKDGINFCGVAVRPQDDLEEKIARLNELLAEKHFLEGARVTVERLTRKEVEVA